AQSLAIVHAKAWTGASESTVDDATIVVQNGKVVSIAAGAAAPAGLEVIDAGGKTVTPGLFSGATQIGLVEVSSADDTSDEAVSSGKLGAAFDIAPALNANSLLVEQARSDGILWALSYPSGSAAPPFLGQAVLLRLQDGQVLERAKAAVFARIGGSAASNAGGSRAAEWTLLRRALDEAKLLKAGRLPPADDRLFSRIDLEALQPIIGGIAPLAIQTDRSSDIREAIRLKRDYQLKLVLVGAVEAWTVADQLARERIPVILDPAADLPISYDALGARLENAAILDRAGVALGITTPANMIDTNYNVGVSSRTAAGIAVANGLPYASAIRSLTLGPASIWGASDRAGSIAAGKDADIVIWDGDPLEPSSAPVVTIVAGRTVSTLTREQQLARRYSPRTDKTWPPAYH
ncbi:MAG: amidohydrolase family protein, partial [Sphingomonas sp.]|nr:amidohydrolase family protein [Sphingomonas sp.]